MPAPFNTSPEPFELITQGAEALVYKTPFLAPDNFTALKIRPKKEWRHPTLDKRLTRQRILAEARVLNKCRKEGVPVPAVLGMDWERGWIASEWIDGKTVKEAIRKRDVADDEGLKALLRNIGLAVGKLHGIGVIHGDLTTSNMMLRPATTGSKLAGEIVLIDFGLATQAVQEEDRAVDLYVLERAYGSTHPREEGMFETVLEAYATTFKGAKSTLRRLEDDFHLEAALKERLASFSIGSRYVQNRRGAINTGCQSAKGATIYGEMYDHGREVGRRASTIASVIGRWEKRAAIILREIAEAVRGYATINSESGLKTSDMFEAYYRASRVA